MLATTTLRPPAPASAAGGADPILAAQPYLATLTGFLEEQVESFEPQLRDLVRYMLASQGKRIRPMLVFFSGWNEAGSLGPDHTRAAAIVELVHLATLLHDDVLDKATLRHQSPTVSRKYGAEVAVLLGDALFCQALKLAADYPTVDICRIIALSTRKVCAGEIRQTLEHGTRRFSLGEYFEVIGLKTGELFGVSCLLGSRLAGYPEAFVQATRRFGLQLGIAYQIFDDVADFCGDEGKIGKTLGTDLARGKFTLPLLWLLERLPENQATMVRHEVLGGSANLRELANRMNEIGVFEAVRARFETELHAAEDSLKGWNTLAPVPKLLGLANYVRLQLDRVIGR